MFQKFLEPSDFQRFHLFSIKRFVASFSGISWCPEPNCESCVKALDGYGGDDDDVECGRGHSFCFSCRRSAHKPATCDAMKKWDKKENTEGLSIKFIKETLKARPCPKCSIQVQRDSGCNKVKCIKCSFSFCFVCGGDYYKTHDYPNEAWECNKVITETQHSAFDAPSDLDLYQLFHDRYMSAIESSRAMIESFPKLEESITSLYKKIISYSASSSVTMSDALTATLAKTSPTKHFHSLSSSSSFSSSSSSSSSPGLYAVSNFDEIGLSLSDFEFIREAGRTVVKGRIAIANSYAHAFFIDRKDTKEAALFSSWQSQLEGTVESLHQRVQSSLLELLINDDVKGFMAALNGRDPTEESKEVAPGLKLTRPKSAPTLSSSSSTGGACGISSSAASKSPSTPSSHESIRTVREAFKEYRVRILTSRSTAESFMKSICDGVSAGVLEGYDHFTFQSSSSAIGGGGGLGRRGVARPHEDTEDEKIKNQEKTARYKQMDFDEQLALKLQAEEDGGRGDAGDADDNEFEVMD
jgi:hypothetical protein